MYREEFTKELISCADATIVGFVLFLYEQGIYDKMPDGSYIITEKGKKESDYSDYLHRNGMPYHERGDY